MARSIRIYYPYTCESLKSEFSGARAEILRLCAENKNKGKTFPCWVTIRPSSTKSDCNRWSAKTATSEDVHNGASGNRELLTAADFDAHAKDDSAKVKLKNERNNEKIFFYNESCTHGCFCGSFVFK